MCPRFGVSMYGHVGVACACTSVFSCIWAGLANEGPKLQVIFKKRDTEAEPSFRRCHGIFFKWSGVSFGEPSHGPKYPRVGLEVQFQGLKNSQELRKTLGRRRKLVSAKTLTLLLYLLSYYANYRVGQQYLNSTSCFFYFFSSYISFAAWFLPVRY